LHIRGQNVPTRTTSESGDGSAIIDKTSRIIKRTFIIHFFNDTISINGKNYKNKEKTTTKPEIPRIQITPVEAERLQTLLLEALKALHIKKGDTCKHWEMIRP